MVISNKILLVIAGINEVAVSSTSSTSTNTSHGKQYVELALLLSVLLMP